MAEVKLNVQEQVRLILDIANILRGPFKEDEYQKIIIPMTICRRFECMLDPTRDAVTAEIKAGRDNDQQRIICQLVGMGSLDLSVATLVYNRVMESKEEVARINMEL